MSVTISMRNTNRLKHNGLWETTINDEKFIVRSENGKIVEVWVNPCEGGGACDHFRNTNAPQIIPGFYKTKGEYMNDYDFYFDLRVTSETFNLCEDLLSLSKMFGHDKAFQILNDVACDEVSKENPFTQTTHEELIATSNLEEKLLRSRKRLREAEEDVEKAKEDVEKAKEDLACQKRMKVTN